MTKQKESGFAQLAHESSLYPQEKLVAVNKGNNSFFIGVPNEISLQEKRVTLTPDAVELLVNNGHEVWVETKAGEGAKYRDKQYSDAGAKIVYSAEEIYKSADAILKIEPPTLDEIGMMKNGQTLISAIQLGNQTPGYIRALNSKNITALAFEFMEDKVGGMPIIRAMSEIAGNTVMSIAAEYLNSAKGGRGIILGGITGVPPAEVVIIGSGTVAEYAGRAALGLGATVKVFDNQIYKLRRIKHALGQQIYTSTIDSVTLADSLRDADVVIGALRAEKGRNRYVVTEEMVAAMKPDSIIVDLSIDQGGCVETSELTTLKDPVFRKYEVIHYCVPNVASRVASTATMALSNIFTPTILRAAEQGGFDEMIFSHKWFMKGVYTYKGSLTNEYIARKFNMKCKDLSLLMAARF